jgi:hypothetical protein
LREGQGGRELLASVRFVDQESHRDQGQGNVVMPALPRAHLEFVHSRLPLPR